MEYKEIRTMLNIVLAVVANSHIEQCSAFGNLYTSTGNLYTSTVYNIRDSDIATMRKWIAYWKQTIDRCNKTD